jgi:hypothetical protein
MACSNKYKRIDCADHERNAFCYMLFLTSQSLR